MNESKVEVTTNLVVPLVHLNGTSRQALTQSFEAPIKALRHAIDLMIENSPNARDYYPRGDRAFSDAMMQHFSRVARVKDVLAELVAIWEAIEDQ